MELRIYNRIILMVSLVLLFLSVFVICYAIKFNGVKIELGSFSDWVSSLSTFGTLIVAFMAYKKAPEWINQKMNEDAFSIAKRIMLDDYLLLKRKIDRAGAWVGYNYAQLEMIGDEFKLFISVDDCKKALSVFHELQHTPSEIKNNLESLSKLGWSIKPEVLTIHEQLDVHYKAMQKNYVMAYTAINTIIANPDRAFAVEYSKAVERNFKNFVRHEEQFDIHYEKLRGMHRSILEYFYVKRQ
ncbi:TPA: hypothetical protein MEX89_001453 [Klebsiella pneumoniae]|uniref:hypothetical protein n=1 Tax=Klebsiella pneumoniae TaxID=573 RepID=UPI00330310CA|nr:hypothetical protein [Klebsiella pneumoniae]HBW3131254.1 hypothetical protein [Klebsiella pneumoniae]HBW3168267.1 hypothetical protein [Klebsiella pneumoniae]HBW3239763.1 hypothetical protein [Klebsiella pneumoniae]HBW3245233.1 hypothetical protein [Klebsiella pneumoniae]